jgi:hypothetical protein
MRLADFGIKVGIVDKTEVEKARLIAFYYSRIEDKLELTMSDIALGFIELSLPKPNISRLRENLRKSSILVRGSKTDLFRLHARELNLLDNEYPGIRLNENDPPPGTSPSRVRVCTSPQRQLAVSSPSCCAGDGDYILDAIVR